MTSSSSLQNIFRMNTVFGIPVINILWTIVAGRRFQHGDPQVERMMNLLNRFVSLRGEESDDWRSVSDCSREGLSWSICSGGTASSVTSSLGWTPGGGSSLSSGRCSDSPSLSTGTAWTPTSPEI